MKFLRWGICALISFAVAAHGGVEDWARAILETGVAFLFSIWALRFYFNEKEQPVFSPLLPPLALFLLVVLGQWVFHATASVYNTRIELLLLLASLIFLFLCMQVFHTLVDWRGFVWFGMGLGFVVSVFAILQHLTFNGKLYWFRELRSGGEPFGPYVNRNHFAGFAELVLPLALVPLVLGKVRRERVAVVALFAIIPVVALFLSASRGGIVSFCVQLAFLTHLLLRRRGLGKHLLSVAAVLLAAVLMVTWLGVGQILERFSSFQSLEVTEGKRAAMRRGAWHIFLDHPLAGTGLGTFQIVYPRYETLYDGKIVNHAHNDYLEALAETGVLGGLCCAWFLVVLLLKSLSRFRENDFSFAGALQLSGMVACAGFLVHALVDFNSHIPSNLWLFLLMAHLATAEIQQPRPSAPSTQRRRHISSHFASRTLSSPRAPICASSFRKLAAIDIVFLGYKLVFVEYAFGVLFSIVLGTFVLYRGHSVWQVVLGTYLICLGINYVPMFVYTVSIGSKQNGQAELADELTDKRKAISKYRRLSVLLLVPLLVPVLVARGRPDSN